MNQGQSLRNQLNASLAMRTDNNFHRIKASKGAVGFEKQTKSQAELLQNCNWLHFDPKEIVADDGLQKIKTLIAAQEKHTTKKVIISEDDDELDEMQDENQVQSKKKYETLLDRKTEIDKSNNESLNFMDTMQKLNLEYLQQAFNMNETCVQQKGSDQEICLYKELSNCGTKTILIKGQYYFITIGNEMQTLQNQYDRPVIKDRAVLVIHHVQSISDEQSHIKQIHVVELNNIFLSQHPKQHKAYQIFGNNIFYYKIDNDLEKKTVTYRLYRFSFETCKEDLITEHQEQANLPIIFVAFAHQKIQHLPAKAKTEEVHNNEWSRRISLIQNQRQASLVDKDNSEIDVRDLEQCRDEDQFFKKQIIVIGGFHSVVRMKFNIRQMKQFIKLEEQNMIAFKEKGLRIQLIYKNLQTDARSLDLTDNILVLSISTSNIVNQTKLWHVKFEQDMLYLSSTNFLLHTHEFEDQLKNIHRKPYYVFNSEWNKKDKSYQLCNEKINSDEQWKYFNEIFDDLHILQDHETDTINIIKDQNLGVVMIFQVLYNKFVFIKVVLKSLDTKIQEFIPFKNVRVPNHGKQFGDFKNVFYANNVTKQERWNNDFSVILITDDFSQITIPDKKEILITQELIKDYNVFRYDKLPSSEEKKKLYKNNVENNEKGEKTWAPQIVFADDLKDTRPILVRVSEDKSGEDRGIYLRIDQNRYKHFGPHQQDLITPNCSYEAFDQVGLSQSSNMYIVDNPEHPGQKYECQNYQVSVWLEENQIFKIIEYRVMKSKVHWDRDSLLQIIGMKILISEDDYSKFVDQFNSFYPLLDSDQKIIGTELQMRRSFQKIHFKNVGQTEFQHKTEIVNVAQRKYFP